MERLSLRAQTSKPPKLNAWPVGPEDLLIALADEINPV